MRTVARNRDDVILSQILRSAAGEAFAVVRCHQGEPFSERVTAGGSAKSCLIFTLQRSHFVGMRGAPFFAKCAMNGAPSRNVAVFAFYALTTIVFRVGIAFSFTARAYDVTIGRMVTLFPVVDFIAMFLQIFRAALFIVIAMTLQPFSVSKTPAILARVGQSVSTMTTLIKVTSRFCLFALTAALGVYRLNLDRALVAIRVGRRPLLVTSFVALRAAVRQAIRAAAALVEFGDRFDSVARATALQSRSRFGFAPTFLAMRGVPSLINCFPALLALRAQPVRPSTIHAKVAEGLWLSALAATLRVCRWFMLVGSHAVSPVDRKVRAGPMFQHRFGLLLL